MFSKHNLLIYLLHNKNILNSLYSIESELPFLKTFKNNNKIKRKNTNQLILNTNNSSNCIINLFPQ